MFFYLLPLTTDNRNTCIILHILQITRALFKSFCFVLSSHTHCLVMAFTHSSASMVSSASYWLSSCGLNINQLFCFFFVFFFIFRQMYQAGTYQWVSPTSFSIFGCCVNYIFMGGLCLMYVIWHG
jgi:hypothetical protein